MSVEDKRVGIHQPNYFPWVGYFIKLHVSDIFIFHDDVEHSKSSLTRRTKIRKRYKCIEESSYLRVPLEKHHDTTLIKDLKTFGQDWLKANIDQVKKVYARAPFYDEVMPFLEETMQHIEGNNFSGYTSRLIQEIGKVLDLNAEYHYSSEMKSTGKKDEYNVSLVKEAGGNEYLSGMGAKKYQDEAVFKRENIGLSYIDPMSYLKEMSSEKVNFTYSIIEVLFQCGFRETERIIKEYKL